MESQTMGKRIMALRKAAGLTQEQLAEHLGLSAQAVSKWENDVSSPDISNLPQLAAILGVSTDVLLGTKPQEEKEAPSEATQTQQSGGFFSGRDHGALGLGVLAIVIGLAYLVGSRSSTPFNVWSVVWPAVLMGLGISETLRRFSPLSLGAALLGLYFLLYNLGVNLLPFVLTWSMIWPAALILLGITLIFFKKSYRTHNHDWTERHGKVDFIEEDGFIRSSVQFSEQRRRATTQHLAGGDIHASFCSNELDCSGVTSVENGAVLHVNVSFGACTLLLPRSIQLTLQTTTTFGDTEVIGNPIEDAPYTLTIAGSVSFGQLELRYY